MYVFCLRVWSTFTTAECPTVVWSPVTVWWTGVLSWRSQTTATTRFWMLRDSLVTTHLKMVREPIGWWTGVKFCFSWCGLFVWVVANQCSSACFQSCCGRLQRSWGSPGTRGFTGPCPATCTASPSSCRRWWSEGLHSAWWTCPLQAR